MIYVIALGKGGCGKTTTAAALACELAKLGRKVLALDVDRQGNFSSQLGVNRDTTEVDAVAADVLKGEATAVEAAIPAPNAPGVDIIAGTQDLMALEYMPEIAASLVNYLPTLTEWDDVVIDTPPALGVVTLAALAAADIVVCPVSAEAQALEQVDDLKNFIANRASRLRPGQKIHAIIPTRCDTRRVLDRDFLAILHERNPGIVQQHIREAVAAREAYVAREPIHVYAPDSTVAKDYAAAIAPIIGGDTQ